MIAPPPKKKYHRDDPQRSSNLKLQVNWWFRVMEANLVLLCSLHPSVSTISTPQKKDSWWFWRTTVRTFILKPWKNIMICVGYFHTILSWRECTRNFHSILDLSEPSELGIHNMKPAPGFQVHTHQQEQHLHHPIILLMAEFSGGFHQDHRSSPQKMGPKPAGWNWTSPIIHTIHGTDIYIYVYMNIWFVWELYVIVIVGKYFPPFPMDGFGSSNLYERDCT